MFLTHILVRLNLRTEDISFKINRGIYEFSMSELVVDQLGVTMGTNISHFKYILHYTMVKLGKYCKK